MIKKIIVFTILLHNVLFYSQEELIGFNLDLKENSTDIKDVIPVVNINNGDIVVFVVDAKLVYAYKLDENFKVIDKMVSENKARKYKAIIGYRIKDENSYHLYLQDKSHKNKLLDVQFSFVDKMTNLKEHKLYSTQEAYIESISYNNNFYILSVPNPNTLIDEKDFYMYHFNAENNFVRKKIDGNLEDFVSKKGKKKNVKDFIYKYKSSISIVNENNPNSIEVVANPIKIYKKNNFLNFTFDNYSSFTQMININLNNFSANYTTYDKPLQSIKEKKKSNSFINGNQIFLIASYSSGLQLNVMDVKSKEIIKDFKIYRDKPITFKNTPIIQEGGMYNKHRELEETKKFIRKINSGKIGVSVKALKNNSYQITLGGYVEQKGNAGMMMPMVGFGGIPIASFGNITMSFNPTQFAYGSYTNSKSIRIESLVDLEFNHIEGEIQDNAFDRIRDYKENVATTKETKNYNSSKGVQKIPSDTESVSDTNANTIFKYKDYFIKTFYNKENKKFSLRKFID